MLPIRAIGFDLFNTLVTVESDTLKVADALLLQSLRESGFRLDEEEYRGSYREEAAKLVKEATQSGIETHNRFWIQAALGRQGYDLDPFDLRIAAGVEAYFTSFYQSTHVIPGTTELLTDLRASYRLGLLSNFTHGPACRRVIAETGLGAFFDVIIISGEEGYRKPSLILFQKLLEGLGVNGEQAIYVGDDPLPDIYGSRRAGMRPVWTTYVMDHQLLFAPNLVARDGAAPDGDVPRISGWDDLYRLLGIKA
jgi:putative hydrolase of the HAD superfamily